jgi:hypothetical protein
MKSLLSKCIGTAKATLFLLVSFLSLQPLLGEGKGILTFLNAVPLDTPTQFFINKVSLKPEGFTSGFCTSALLFDAKPQTITAKNSVFESDPVVVTPSSSVSPMVVASLILQEDKVTKEMKPKLVILPANNLPQGKGWNYQIYYSSVKPSTAFQINQEPVTLEGGKGKNFLGIGSRLTIETGGKNIASYTPESPGNFFVILFDKADGSIGSNIVEDNIYFVPPK